MIRDQNPHAATAEGLNQRLQISHGEGVDSGERFIQQEITGPVHANGKSTGHLAATAFATGELKSTAIDERCEVKILNQLITTIPPLGWRQIRLLQRNGQVLANRELAKHTRFLWEVADPQAGSMGHGQRRHLPPIEIHLAMIRP